MTHTITPAHVSVFHHPQFNDQDAAVAAERLALRAAYLHGPQAGDWVRLEDGRLMPIAWTRKGEYTVRFGDPEGLFYLESDGTLSYEGDFGRGVPRDLLHPTNDYHATRAWILHHDNAGVRDQVEFYIALPVWECAFVRTDQ